MERAKRSDQQQSQLPFGWVCFSNCLHERPGWLQAILVSIAFRLGLFL